jgi:hypothetical protein
LEYSDPINIFPVAELGFLSILTVGSILRNVARADRTLGARRERGFYTNETNLITHNLASTLPNSTRLKSTPLYSTLLYSPLRLSKYSTLADPLI